MDAKTTFANAFSLMKCINFDQDFTEVSSHGFN